MSPADAVANFEDDLAKTVATPIRPFILKTKAHGNLAVVLVHAPQATAAYALGERKSHCRTCAARVMQMHNLEGQDGPMLFPRHVLDRFSSEHEHYPIFSQMSDLGRSTTRGGPTLRKLRVVRGDSVCGPRTQGADAAGTAYSHWHLPLTEEFRSDARVTEECADMWERAFHRYITSDDYILDRLVHRLCAQGTASLDLMAACLRNVAYGGTFLPAVAWMRGVLDDLAERGEVYAHMAPGLRWIFLAEQLAKAGIAKDYGAAAVSPLVQTAIGNIMDLLECAHSEADMLALCHARLCPLNYQRRTADASEGQIATAVKELGDFRNDVMLLSELTTIVPETVAHHIGGGGQGGGGSLAAFHAQQKKLKKKADKSSSFATRCGVDDDGTMAAQIKRLTKVSDFVALTRQHPELSVEIRRRSATTVNAGYLATTTLDKSKLQPFAQRHLWAFLDSSLGIPPNLRMPPATPPADANFAPVSHTVPMYEYTAPYKSVLFVVAGAALVGGDTAPWCGNCCFPEFLSTPLRRVCGPAFESLNRTMKLAVPDAPHVVGVGSSGAGSDGELAKVIALRVGGHEVHLTHI